MPRAIIEYVVSFSSEDPENPAKNLLCKNVSSKRWLCPKGTPSCSVVLQLTHAVKVNTINVGVCHAALVEILVGRSETPNEPFQVLVPSCVFLSPSESRREEYLERVRSFSSSQLAADARAQRWDRLRVVCSQPYNKHCKYGLSFVHVSSSEEGGPGPGPGPTSLPARVLLPDTDGSSDDDFAPGELFARHRRDATQDTGAQIRQATSQALKNISDSATKLVKTPISKHNSKRPEQADSTATADRRRDHLLYTDDDDRPHAKIDHIVQRHKDEKTKEEAKKPTSEKQDKKKDRGDKIPKDEKKNRSSSSKESRNESSSAGNSSANESDRKRPRESRDHHTKKASAPEAVELQSLLKGVVFVLSGYVNPERAELRDLALAMGARAERDWSDACNTLICAFPNTPKLKQVRAGPGGERVPAATGAWLRECRARRRRLPWRWYATEPGLRLPVDTGLHEPAHAPASEEEECDTDDEIEKALRKQKKQRTERSCDRNYSRRARSRDTDKEHSRRRSDESRRSADTSDVVFVRDERVQGNVTVHDSDDDAGGGATDEDDAVSPRARIEPGASLPELFGARTFVIDASVARAGFKPRLLARYVRAYGGLVLDASELEAASEVDYVLATDAASDAARDAARVRPDWLWRCHAERALHPLGDYLLT